MRPYEVMIIFDADLEEETIRSAVARYTQLIVGEGAGARPGRLLGEAALRLRDSSTAGRATTWSSRRRRSPRRWRSCTGSSPLPTTSDPSQGPAHSRARLREARRGQRDRRVGKEEQWPTAPSPSSGTSPATRRSATPWGAAKATFGVAVSRRWQNRQTNEWEEQTSFFNVVCWRRLAENVSESLGKGSRVIVTGRLEQRSWETENGEKRSVVEIVADEVGPSLRWASAAVTRN